MYLLYTFLLGAGLVLASPFYLVRFRHYLPSLKDRFGLSWQIVPRQLNELVADPDPERARRAMEAMLKMGKIDVAELERGADAA